MFVVDPVVLLDVIFVDPRLWFPPVIVCERVLELPSSIVLFDELALPDVPLDMLPVELDGVAVLSGMS
jgi:hypothetical protein